MLMKLEIVVSTPPHRESRVAEIRVPDPTRAIQPAEIYLEKGVRMIAFYPVVPGRKNIPWEIPLADLLAAILDAYEDPNWDGSK